MQPIRTLEEKKALLAQIARLMREDEDLNVADACKRAGITNFMYYDWRKRHGKGARGGYRKRLPKSVAAAELIPLPETTPISVGHVFVIYGSPVHVADAVRRLA